MSQLQAPALSKPSINWSFMFTLLLAFTLPMISFDVLATPPAASGTFSTACNSVNGIFGNMNKILNVISVVIVTIAIIFAGYQIAFAHKRIADVAPILIGGLLIGAASQIAAWLLPNTVASC